MEIMRIDRSCGRGIRGGILAREPLLSGRDRGAGSKRASRASRSRAFNRRPSTGRRSARRGQYEKLVGRVYGEVDPHDPLNSLITDIGLAPRNARGMVEYSSNIMIIRPIDREKGNHKLLFEINNRGLIFAFASLNDAAENSNDPTHAADAGNGFMMRQGYTLAWSGWDAISGVTPGTGGGSFVLDAPVAKNADGSPVTGPSLEEFVIDNDTTASGALTYPAASLDTSKATLFVRARVDDEPTALPANAWRYDAAGKSISLLPEGTKFQSGKLYELVYPAKDPKVTGLGFAAIRDFASFLHNAKADDQGKANPLAGDIKEVLTYCISQPCRMMRDFVALGFNQDADAPKGADGKREARKVVDGVLDWVGGGSGIFADYRFAEPFRTHRQHIARWYPEYKFPFAWPLTTDAVTGKTDGLLRRCLESGTCPKIIDANSDNEYWAKAASVLHTDTQGRDLRRDAGGAALSHRRQAPWRWRAGLRARYLPAGAQPARRQSRASRAARGARQMGRDRRRAAAEPRAAARRGDARLVETRRCRISGDPGRGLQRANAWRRPLRFRPAGRSRHLDDVAAEAPRFALSSLRAEDRCRRQHARWHSPSRYCRADGDVHGLEPAQESAR